MNLLLDTNIFIWFINGDNQIPLKVVRLIKNINNKCYLSIASIWEIAIKYSLKKLELKGKFNKIQDFLIENEIEILPITFEHIQELLKLESHHRNPFDRMIISQALCDELPIVTKDENFKKYRVKVIW